MDHSCSVFNNSCLKVPVDPITKMPKTAYERKRKTIKQQNSIDSISTTCSVSTADIDAEKLKHFYKSIPDYSEINHLPEDQFYSTLKSLREKKKHMLRVAVEHIDHCNGNEKPIESILVKTTFRDKESCVKCKNNSTQRRKYSEKIDIVNNMKNNGRLSSDADLLTSKVTKATLRRPSRKCTAFNDSNKNLDDDLRITPDITPLCRENVRSERPKRIQSACSISWNDAKIENTEVDQKFDEFFDGRKYTRPTKVDIGNEFKTQSMPSSPLRTRSSSARRLKSITIPKPFKMTERDEEDRIVNELRSLHKSFSDDMLHQKMERRRFKANPVPIESRIPLYDKILEDQAMRFPDRTHAHLKNLQKRPQWHHARRAITKINSEAELRAQMKPFSFTKREEKGITAMCDRALEAMPKGKKKKRFRARPFPKNLFSNYFYDKMKEEEFFRGMNRRIRAEEMLRTAKMPGAMAIRDRSRLSTPAAHSDLPIDPSPVAPSTSSSDKRCSSPTKACSSTTKGCSSPMKGKRRNKSSKEDFITTSPQPFKFSTADRANKKMEEITRKIYQESKSSDSTALRDPGSRVYSAMELRAAASGRSNLAALLRAEAVRRRFEQEQTRRLEEQHRRAELRQRDRLLRSKPAWDLVKNNHEEDIAMRLQTRRDEERMRREEFLHEMELMYNRVQQQPMLFERYYAPRSHSAPLDSIQLSPRKTKKRGKKNFHFNSPVRSRKVSINDTAETFNGDVAEYLNRFENDDISDSEVPIDTDRDKV